MKINHSPLTSQFVESMNAQNSTAFVACFAPEAIVEDEGHIHQGRSEIQAWIEAAFAAYQPVLEVTSASTTEEGAVITGLVSGSFPGSPIVLNYHLKIADQQITGLKCVI